MLIQRRRDGNLEVLERDLAHFEEVGFNYVEIPIDGVDGVVRGEPYLRSAEKVQEVLRKYHLKATIHYPGPLHLRERDF